MKGDNSKIKRVILFISSLEVQGGGGRLLFEEFKFLRQNGIETHILCYDFNPRALFNGSYNVDINIVTKNLSSKSRLIKTIYRTIALRKKIKDIKPDIILSQVASDYVYVYLATLFTPFTYASHVHETVSWFESSRKYALIYKRAMNEIRQSIPGHEQFTSPKAPHRSLTRRIFDELYAMVEYFAVRKAKKIFVLSNQMKWEVDKLYGKEAVVVKGGLSPQIFHYKPEQDIKQKLGLQDNLVVLSVCRLNPKKKVDLIIKAFGQVCEKFEYTVLVIGGSGSEENKLKDMVRELNIEDKVKFVGYITEEELWDYYTGCDLFVSAEWVDFNISLLEALALQRKVVCPTSIEIDDNLTQNRHIFAANLTVDDFALSMETALTTEITEKNDLSNFTWDKYCERILKELKSI